MQRAIDLRSAIAVNVITMIGIGPLVTIPLVLAALGGPLALIGWVAGAIVALCDGLVWAELSSQYPGSGGTYVYLRQAFGEQTLGRGMAFLFNWQFLLAAPCLLASGYIAFAQYAAYLYPAVGSNWLLRDGVAIGVGILTIATLYRRTARVAGAGTVLAYAAVFTIALIACAALTHANFSQAFHLDTPFAFNAGFLTGFGTALYIALYDYVGYAEVALLGDEVVRPNRTIPRAILLSVVIVAVLYILLQIGVLGVVPWRSLLDAHGVPTDAAQYVGSTIVQHVWGRWAAVGVTLLVLVTAFASLYGNLFGFSRIPFAAARDGAFLPAFAKLHPRKDIPHVSLLCVGGLSLVASLLTLDQVIAFLTAGIVLVQGVAQVFALAVVRRRGVSAPFRMPLYPLPALIALVGWIVAFVSTGTLAIELGLGWLGAGAVVYLIVARKQRWWPFILTAAMAGFTIFGLALPAPSIGATLAPQWASWNASKVVQERGYPVYTVDGHPFFVYGAAFFYERIPREQWRSALVAYRRLGINTIDLYAIWNWHQPDENQAPDFTGRTNPQRDLLGLLGVVHELGFHVVLRPGPVIRNEWRNGGYPDWLLQRPEYNMPLHDVLEGRYPATATLQNAHADAAGAQWLRNPAHLERSGRWLRDVLTAVAPYSHDVIAVALDDDQGAYLDNDTWPAPHWRAYINWLRLTVTETVGPRVPVFVNTFEMKVTAASPVWAWGDWYQSDAYSIGVHDLAQLDFATGLLQTQLHQPIVYAEFQAGWLQGADEAHPRPSDPVNTALALHELLRDGAAGVVNFPVQDTIYPDGWEAPWANWSYAWDAALTADLGVAPRYAPTFSFGNDVTRYGSLLARTHPVADAAIVWPPSMFSAQRVTDADVAAFADATIAMQRECAARQLTCALVDLGYADDTTLARYPVIVVPIVPNARLRATISAPVLGRLDRLRKSGRLAANLPSSGRIGSDDTTVLVSDDDSYAFVDAVNPSNAPRTIGPLHVVLNRGSVTVPAFALPPRSARLVPVDALAATNPRAARAIAASPAVPRSNDPAAIELTSSRLRVSFAPNAGARIRVLGAGGSDNAATSIGLLRDAVDPPPPPSARDYIAAYTHPLPAGTFNRPYACTHTALEAHCTYDAPDLPTGGGRFERTLALDPDGNEVTIDERLTATDPASTAKLASISGFAYEQGDALIAPSGAGYVGILHGRRLTAIRWQPNDVDHVALRQTRGAQLVTIVFRRTAVRLRLGIYNVADAAEAQRLFQANRR